MPIPQRTVQLTEPSEFLKEHPEAQFVDLLTADINGVVRDRRIKRNSLNKVFEKDTSLPASLLALDITGSTVESIGLGLDIGDIDRICYPIPGTLSMEPWQKRSTAQLLMTMHELRGEPLFAGSREVLHQVVTRFTEVGLTIAVAFELESYLVGQESMNNRPQPLRSPVSGKRSQSVQVYFIDDLNEYVECLQDITDGAHVQSIPADATIAKSTPAQLEINLNHVSDALKACDRAMLLKRLVKNIVYDYEVDTIFMAKPYPDQTGDELYVHISLLDRHGGNILTNEDLEQNAILHHTIDDMLKALPASMAFPHPNINSYRCSGSQFYVPNVPSWGLDDRTVALRVPTGGPGAIRPEHRVTDANANPYLLLATVPADIHHGLANKVEPGVPIEGNSCEQVESSLPSSLYDALRRLDENEIIAKYTDPKCIDIFVTCKESGPEGFEHSISDLEYNWCLYTI